MKATAKKTKGQMKIASGLRAGKLVANHNRALSRQ
jgi:hypothetical protein